MTTKKKAPLPKSLDIDGYRIRILSEQPKLRDAAIGEYRNEEQVIRIRPGLQGGPGQDLDVLFHEVFHCISDLRFTEERDQLSEAQVWALGMATSNLLMKNPNLMAYINAKVNE